MIRFETIIPIITALTISTSALQSCNTIMPSKEEKTELVKNPSKDTFEKATEGKLDIPFATETILGILGLVAIICGLHYLKNPTESKKHLFGEKQDEQEVNKN